MNITSDVIVLLLFTILSLTVHEFCHAWVAYRLGDDTAHSQGRLTIDPRAHIDPFMTIILPAILLLSTQGAFAFGGAKPVPINPRNFRNPGLGMLLTSVAGPMGNLLLAGIAAAVFHLLPVTVDFRGHHLAANVVMLNLVLALFNLVPIPPLDGSRILRYFLGAHGKELLDRIEPFGILIVALLLYSGFFSVLAPIQEALFRFLLL